MGQTEDMARHHLANRDADFQVRLLQSWNRERVEEKRAWGRKESGRRKEEERRKREDGVRRETRNESG